MPSPQRRKLTMGKLTMSYTLMHPIKGGGASNYIDTTGGQWSIIEARHHLNYLELKAVLLGPQSLCKNYVNSHVKVMTDNTTTVAYICNMGVPSHWIVMRLLELYGYGASPERSGSLSVTFLANTMLLLTGHPDPLTTQRNGNLMLTFSIKLSADGANQTLICLPHD